jgi:transglutaminase-like putative cysteine protease
MSFAFLREKLLPSIQGHAVIFDIIHTTEYRYAQPVQLGEHRIMFRPRDSHDLRVLATDLQIEPEPQDVRLVQDVYSNSVVIVQPQSPATQLKVVCSVTVDHTGSRALDLPLCPDAQFYPFDYSAEDLVALQPYLAPYYTDPDGALLNWARQFVTEPQAIGSMDLLVNMTQAIRHSCAYVPRFEEGVQTPLDTLSRQSGTCRDFATLMIEAVRQLGYAARFVSGYLYTPVLDSADAQSLGTGATHAWLHAYLPGAGWIPFDPTNNLVGGTDLIRVAVARHATLASPLSGSWEGLPSDYLGMTVDVQVHKR